MLAWQKTQWVEHLPEHHAIMLLAMNHEQITSAMGSVYGKKIERKALRCVPACNQRQRGA